MNIILRTCDSLVLNALQLLLRSYYDTHAKLAINLDKKENERNKRDTEAKDAVESETNKDREKSKHLARKHLPDQRQ